APRIHRGMEINYGREPVLPQEPQEPIGIESGLENDLGSPLENPLSPQLRLQLQAMRAE
ncbi:hypothetical protein BGZ54_003203, partial [Gamsiella multidivaricata]